MRHRHPDQSSVTESFSTDQSSSDYLSTFLCATGRKAQIHPSSQRKNTRYSYQLGRSIRLAAFGCLVALVLPLLTTALLPSALSQAEAQSSGAIQLKASRVEANSNTGVVTAVGNVRIDYPSRQIFATAAQAQYYSREQRIVLSGNVDVIQEGNSLKAETVTYLIEEGRFVATPGAENQVEAVYLVPEEEAVLEPSSSGESPAPAATPTPPSLPSPPDELPADLSSLDVEEE